MVENVLTYAIFVGESAILVSVTILVDWIDWGPQRYEHYNTPLYDVYTSRHLYLHWAQQIALFGLIQIICGQKHAIGRLVGV